MHGSCACGRNITCLTGNCRSRNLPGSIQNQPEPFRLPVARGQLQNYLAPMVCPISQPATVSLSPGANPNFALAGVSSATKGLRSYSPELGRWVNRDPIRERGGRNLVAFLANDDLCSFDVAGMIRGVTPSAILDLPLPPELAVLVVRRISEIAARLRGHRGGPTTPEAPETRIDPAGSGTVSAISGFTGTCTEEKSQEGLAAALWAYTQYTMDTWPVRGIYDCDDMATDLMEIVNIVAGPCWRAVVIRNSFCVGGSWRIHYVKPLCICKCYLQPHSSVRLVPLNGNPKKEFVMDAMNDKLYSIEKWHEKFPHRGVRAAGFHVVPCL